MRLLSTGVAELARNARWLIEKRLQVIEELASNPQATANPVPSEWEAYGRLHRAEELGDREAEDEAIVDLIRAQMWQWWPDVPERQLLVDLYRRAAQRNARRGSADSRRRPTHTEGLRVAKALLAGVQGRSGLDPAKESLAVTETLMRHFLAPLGQCRTCDLEEYIQRSDGSRAYFDALHGITDVLCARDEDIPRPLVIWWAEIASRRRFRPPLKPLPPNRPVNSAHLVRDVQICFTIEILRRVGVPPRGSLVSGCSIVAEALEISEDAVERIWKGRIWEKSPEPVLRKYLDAVSERTGLGYDAEA